MSDEPKLCIECGTPIKNVWGKVRKKTAKFCSNLCKGAGYKKYLSGMNSPNFKHGIDAWRRQYNEQVPITDTCVLCGKKLKDKFHIDHADGNHWNNDPSNLKMVHPACHSKKTRKEQLAGNSDSVGLRQMNRIVRGEEDMPVIAPLRPLLNPGERARRTLFGK